MSELPTEEDVKKLRHCIRSRQFALEKISSLLKRIANAQDDLKNAEKLLFDLNAECLDILTSIGIPKLGDGDSDVAKIKMDLRPNYLLDLLGELERQARMGDR